MKTWHHSTITMKRCNLRVQDVREFPNPGQVGFQSSR